MPLQLLTANLIYRQLQLEAVVARGDTDTDTVVVGDPTFSPQQWLHPPRFNQLLAVLARENPAFPGQLLSFTEPEHGELAGPRCALPKEQVLLSRLDVSPSQLSHRLLRVLQGRALGLPGKRPTVHILNENELIREILPHLLLGGVNVRYLPRFAPPKPAPEPIPHLPEQGILKELLDSACTQHGVRVNTHPVAALIFRTLRHSSRYWEPSAASGKKAAKTLLSAPGAHLLLTNTVSGLQQHTFCSACQASGVPLVLAEHGVSAGLSRMYEPMQNFSEAVCCDKYLVCSENTKRFYEAGERTKGKARTVGLPAIVRNPPQKHVRRFFVRRHLGSGSCRVVVYLGRPQHGNLRYIPYSSADEETHLVEKAMVHEVMPRVHGMPLIKLYDTRMHVDPNPFTETFPAPHPVATLQQGDFRFLRDGVDAIITHSPKSTLGWVFGAGVPTFYIDQPSLGLLPEVRELMRASVFFFSTEDPGWKEALLASINKPSQEITDEWRAKSSARKRFLDSHVFGPENAGRTASREILSLLDTTAS